MNEFLLKLREQVQAIWVKMSPGRRFLMVGSTAVVLLVLIGGVILVTKPYYVPVFTQVPLADAAEITAYLKQANIPFRLGQQGTAVLVPEERVHEIRMQLASEGLPRGGVVGLEIWDKTSLTETDFDRRIRLLRALQGELTRTLLGLEAVENARVHIVLPENTLFVETQNPATASVFLVLRWGQTLAETQIRGISHLIASSVEGLQPENVTIIDNRGNVLSDVLAFSGQAGSDQVLQQLKIERNYETAVERSVQAMLERLFGVGRVVVRAKAELDFRYEELRETRSEPAVGGKGVLISEEIRSESYTGSGGGAGAPGVGTNVPGYVALGGGQGDSAYEKEEITRNYEINVSEIYQVKAPGELRMMSVAVWIDGELAENQQEQLMTMVASAAGIRPERGDTIQIAAMPFAADWAEPAMVAMGTAIPLVGDWRVLLILGAVALATVVFILRRRTAVPEVPMPVPPPREEIVPDLAPRERELTPQEQQRLQVRRQVERMADEDPEGLSRLLRAWMADD